MSINEMSKTLRTQILARLKEQYTTTSGRTSSIRLDNFLDYTSSDRIRADTDSAKGRHESILSRGAFAKLAKDINGVLQTRSVAGIIDQNLNSDITFEAFKEYVIKEVGISLGSNKKRKTDGFEYTGAPRTGSAAGLTIATATTPQDEEEDPSQRDVLIFRNIPIGKLKEYYVDLTF
jgi:hypothetical protein